MAFVTRILGTRPALVPTLITIPALIVMVALGTWQLQRLAWKTDLLDRIDSRIVATPVPLPAGMPDPAEWEYRRVVASGTYLPDAEFHLLANSLRGNPGYHLISPMERSDGGGLVMVSRGWVPADLKAPETRPGSEPPLGEVQVTGIYRLPWEQGAFVADNVPGDNLWFWPDLAAMGAVLDQPVPGFMIYQDRDPADPDAYPIGGQTRIDIPNNHLEYALTWYGFALALAGIYVAWHRKRAREIAGSGNQEEQGG